MNKRIFAKPLSYPGVVGDIIFALIQMPPEKHRAAYLKGVLPRTYDDTGIAYLLQALGYFTAKMQPTEDWSRFMLAEPRIRREMLRTAFEDTFRAPDGSSATEAVQTIADRRGRVDWFVQKHELSRSTTADYAERLYRKALETLDAASRLDTYEVPLPKETELQPTDPLQTTTSAEAIRAVPRNREQKNKGIELVFWLPDGADSSVYERIFQAADSTIFSKEGHWEPLRDVDPKKVHLNVVKSDQNVPRTAASES